MNRINCSLLPFGVFRKGPVDCRDSEECVGCTPLVINGRVIHYVLRIPDRREAIRFFKDVLGMKILRHEEFSTGCGPACKGFCGTLWSKTMVGYGPEDRYFAFELAYSYTNEKYKNGNGLYSVTIKRSECLTQASQCKWPIDEGNVLVAPGGYKFIILEERIPKHIDPVQKITLACSNMKKTVKYWHGVLGINICSLDHKKKTCGFCFKENTAIIEFQGTEQEINHADSFGRISFTCPVTQLPKIERTIACSKQTIISPLTTVKTNGKDIYRVIILADPDDHEVCFYDEISFRKLSRFNPEASTILERYVELESGPIDKSSSKSASSQMKNTSDKFTNFKKKEKDESDSASAAEDKRHPEIVSDAIQDRKPTEPSPPGTIGTSDESPRSEKQVPKRAGKKHPSFEAAPVEENQGSRAHKPPKRKSSGLVALPGTKLSQSVQSVEGSQSATHWESSESKDNSNETGSAKTTSGPLRRADAEKVVLPTKARSKNSVSEWKQASLAITRGSESTVEAPQLRKTTSRNRSFTFKKQESDIPPGIKLTSVESASEWKSRPEVEKVVPTKKKKEG